MPGARGGKKQSERRPARPGRNTPAGAGRPPLRAPAVPTAAGSAGLGPRGFRGGPEQRPELAAGLRNELADLRAEVRRLAAEIDKLWARERGRGAATPTRTARSIAGKPVRTGTRAARPGAGGGGARSAAGPKRSPGAKRGSGWAKPKSKSRRAGPGPRRQGR